MIMLQRHAATDEARDMAQRACAAATRRGTPVLLAVTREIEPRKALTLYARAVLAGHDATYWEQPSLANVTVAAGVAFRVGTHGGQRFVDAASAWRDLVEGAVASRPNALVAFAGFAFAAPARRAPHWQTFGDGALVVPALTYRSMDTRAEITLATTVQPEQAADGVAFALAPLLQGDSGAPVDLRPSSRVVKESCSLDRWREAVTSIEDAIARGALDKAVLARELRLHADRAFDATGAIARLREGYPDCTVFAFAREGACFMGATPERLVRVQGRKVYATCLAGTALRGRDERGDKEAAAALLADEKERREHEVVVRAITGALTPLCGDLDVPAQPSIMTMPNVLHLHTRIEGTLAARTGVLDLVERLHPTPAVGGMPLDAALSLIRRHEEFDRGWYAGPVGWIDANGDGEFAVALRSALVRGTEARLFAGCGIVAGSDPQREYDESEMKLKPMLAALRQRTASANGQRDEC